jgi:hypothetical protein
VIASDTDGLERLFDLTPNHSLETQSRKALFSIDFQESCSGHLTWPERINCCLSIRVSAPSNLVLVHNTFYAVDKLADNMPLRDFSDAAGRAPRDSSRDPSRLTGCRRES